MRVKELQHGELLDLEPEEEDPTRRAAALLLDAVATGGGDIVETLAHKVADDADRAFTGTARRAW